MRGSGGERGRGQRGDRPHPAVDKQDTLCGHYQSEQVHHKGTKTRRQRFEKGEEGGRSSPGSLWGTLRGFPLLILWGGGFRFKIDSRLAADKLD